MQRKQRNPRKPTDKFERLWNRVVIAQSGECWNWTGFKNANGYGQIQRGRRGEGLVLTHRLAYESKHGVISDNLFICHKCDNPACCNPDHLFLGTREDNEKDKVSKGRQSKGEQRPLAKLTEKMVKQIRIRASKGESHTEIAQTIGVCPQTIDKVCSGKIWKHV